MEFSSSLFSGNKPYRQRPISTATATPYRQPPDNFSWTRFEWINSSAEANDSRDYNISILFATTKFNKCLCIPSSSFIFWSFQAFLGSEFCLCWTHLNVTSNYFHDVSNWSLFEYLSLRYCRAQKRKRFVVLIVFSADFLANEKQETKQVMIIFAISPLLEKGSQR